VGQDVAGIGGACAAKRAFGRCVGGLGSSFRASAVLSSRDELPNVFCDTRLGCAASHEVCLWCDDVVRQIQTHSELVGAKHRWKVAIAKLYYQPTCSSKGLSWRAGPFECRTGAGFAGLWFALLVAVRRWLRLLPGSGVSSRRWMVSWWYPLRSSWASDLVGGGAMTTRNGGSKISVSVVAMFV